MFEDTEEAIWATYEETACYPALTSLCEVLRSGVSGQLCGDNSDNKHTYSKIPDWVDLVEIRTLLAGLHLVR